jgi:Tfp pilus tip-associated adhesin PilY1
MRKIRKFLCALLAALLALPMPAARAAFDPVNDDTDIFLANPNITAERPNVLIILDNTANWNQPFVNEKNALVQVVNGLNDSFNVGLMMMVETGAPNDNVDGGYVRYHVRQMTDTNKTALSSMVNNLDILNDKGNNNTLGLALHEAYLYYAGKASIASFGKVKTDTDGTTDPLLQPLAGQHALPASPDASSLYRSPIADGCAKNFIIYISNGPVNENASARAFIEDKLTALRGTTPSILPLSPSGQQDNWGDELAAYMANNDVHSGFANNQNVFTYTVEVNPGTTGQGPATTALFQSTATQGKGKYFGVTDDASGVAIVDALNAIFNEIQAVNSVFASTTLPVSVNERGTNLNQVYIGVFRPDAVKKPRWVGNLKMYNLALDSATGALFLADASNGIPPQVGVAAVDTATTGFINQNAESFWTQASTFWGFRDPSLNGPGGASDLPDGNLVEKGGAAQQQRIAFATDQTARNLYTCTTGLVSGVNETCTAGSSLSATPFSEANAAIDASTLALGTRQVSPLTAFETKTVTSLTDRKSATLTNAASPVNVTALSNGATATLSVTSLTTATPKTVSSLSASVSGTDTRTVNSITKSGAIWTVAAAGALPASYVVGATVTFSGFANASWNGLALAITAVNTGANTFQVNPPGNPGAAATGNTSVPATVDSTTAVATVAGHGYTDGQSVTIAGASPSQFNGTFSISLGDSTGADPTNKFRYTIAPAAGTATGTITAAGNTTTATVITSAAHGLAVGNSVTISGSNIPDYNGVKTVATVPSATSFTFSAPTAPNPNTASPVYAVVGGSTTVTVTAPLHGFASSPPGTPTVTIANSEIGGYNGTFEIAVTDANTFTFTTSSILPGDADTTTPLQVTASTGFSATVTATVTNHGFGVGDLVIIEGGTEPLHTSSGAGSPAGFTITSVTLPDTFTYTNSQLVAPAGSYTARPPTLSTKAIATITAHGYGAAGATKEVVIAGAAPAAYNGTFTATVVDANTITYPLTSAPGPNTSGSVTSSVKTNTARATSVAHGFSSGDTVAVSGATPAAFNGTFSVIVTDVNNFTYTIASAEGDASGTILATGAGVSSTARDALIRWVRGQDNFEDENLSGSTSDVRASIHGDVLHSRPAVINYNRYGSDNDVYVFYGANDGIFRAIKGGYATDASAAVNIQPGQEAWGFIPSEFFPQLNRLRTNSPIISSAFKKPYFADGPIGTFVKDANGNGILGEGGDTVNLYIGMHRGGRLIYALDVNNPHDPKFLWKIDNNTAGFAELGQTWSRPRVVTNLAGLTTPVVIFGAGYDANVEDLEPSAITASDATSVTTAAGTTNRAMGRGVYVVDATDGTLLWSVGRPGSGATVEISGMDYAIPSDLTVIVNESGGPPNRAYVGDTGGNVWRIDFRNPLSGSMVTKIASLGGAGAAKRKFLFAPEVVKQSGFDAVLVGSGDREHPFDTSVTNRFYMIKDTGSDAGPATGNITTTPALTPAGTVPSITEADMFDATSNCIQDAAACVVGQTSADAVAALTAANGWYVTLASGEKTVGGAAAVGGTVFFGTNQPDSGAGGGACGSNLGIARAYAVSVADATVPNDPSNPGPYTAADRYDEVAGGGYLPSPVYILTTPVGGDTPTETVCMGLFCPKPPGVSLASRLRKYWYKEIDR